MLHCMTTMLEEWPEPDGTTVAQRLRMFMGDKKLSRAKLALQSGIGSRACRLRNCRKSGRLHVMPTEARISDVGEEVRAEMGRQRVSMIELARRTEISRSTLANQVNTNTLTVNNLLLIADALGVTVASLVGEAVSA